MSTATAYAALRRIGPIVTTAEAAATLRVSSSAASRTLRLLRERGLARRIGHGRWTTETNALDPRSVAAEITRPYPSYVSFESALFAHGAIDQVPRDISLASLARPRRVRTDVGTFVIHRLPPALFGGFLERDGVALATLEKAIFDFHYVAQASGRPSRRLPELDVPRRLSSRRVREWIPRIESRRLRALVADALERQLAG
ncbi:MAG: hypothetical protein HYX53_11580 [Chloroflexi bacterium]|nr:hypothetical protein [Chloroflexota bacterium]